MGNDLISREALREALKSNCKPEICHDYGTNWCEACCPHNDFEDLIDNAPTVEPVKQCKYCKHCGNEDYCSNCHSDHSLFEYYERPQGEWYYNCQNGWHCSICHETVKNMPTVMGKANFAFCPNCGAQMQKGGNE